MLKDVLWCAGRDPGLSVGEQLRHTLALMGVRHRRAKGAPEPLDRIAVGVVGRGIHQSEVLAFRVEQRTEQVGAAWGMDAQVVQDDQGPAAARLGASHGALQLLNQGCRPAALGHGPVQPALAPVDQAKAPVSVSKDDCTDCGRNPSGALITGQPREEGRISKDDCTV